MTETNHCGTCTLCCKIMGVSELDKPANVWCQHCAKGKGCTIYETRPASCRIFDCLWLQSQQRPEAERFIPALRPDRSRVVLTATKTGKGVVAQVDPMRPDAWKAEPVQRVLNAAAKVGPVVIAIGRKRYMAGKMTDEQKRIVMEHDVVLEDDGV
jgi:uncharacterized protein